jgi:hypothetical protein
MLFDKVDKLSIQNYLLTTLDGCKMQDLERKMLRNLLLPGTDRYGMPSEAEKSLPIRKAEINEIITFSTIGAEQTERAIVLKAFGNLM